MMTLNYAIRRVEYLEERLADPNIGFRDLYAVLREIDVVRRDVRILQRRHSRPVDYGAAERDRCRKAMAAMRSIQAARHVTIRSRDGMMRLLQAAYGKDTRVRWSWPPTPRAQYASPMFA